MKRNIFTAFLALFATFSFSSCMKEGGRHHKHDTVSETLNVKIASGATYQLDLSKYGDADDLATIATQAANYQVSELSKESTSGKFIYKYVAPVPSKTGAATTDKVVINVVEPEHHGGCNGNGEKDNEDIEAIVTINFTIE